MCLYEKKYKLRIACLIFFLLYIIFSVILFLVIKFLIHHFKILTYFQEKQTKNKNNA
jgi:phosphotransferase system  glucose/maltose/N-acetylglucosamine-specific IIC component